MIFNDDAVIVRMFAWNMNAGLGDFLMENKEVSRPICARACLLVY